MISRAIPESRLVLFGAMALLLFLSVTPFASAEPSGGNGQQSEYEYDVLPGIQASGADTATNFTPKDLRLTQGWHYWQRNAIDIGSSPAGTAVYAVTHAVEPNSQISARVRVNGTGDGCQHVIVEFVRTTSGSEEALGRLRYVHVGRSSSLMDGQVIPLPTMPGSVAVTRLGSLLHAPWVPVRSDPWGTRIRAEVNRRLDDQADPLHADGIGRVGNPQLVNVDGRSFRIRQMFGTTRASGWYEQRWRAALGETSPPSTDGADCASTGPHLHQEEVISTGNSLWRNVDRDGELDDDGFGFPVGQLGSLSFCSDTWVFKLQSSLAAPLASAVEPCGAPRAAPANLTAGAGDRRIALHWDNPNDATITGYRFRVRLSSATSQDAAPWGRGWQSIPRSDAGTTSHTLSDGLVNDVSYTIQIRAVNANGSGPASTAQATTSGKAPPVAADPSLQALALSGISFTFDAAVTSYRVTADDDLSQTTVTATATNPNASLVITPDDADTDTDAHEVQLNVGTTTISVTVSHAGETRVYSVQVNRPDPFVAPIITGFSASGTTLTGHFTWAGSSPRFLKWFLLRATSKTSSYSQVGGPLDDSQTPVVFRGQSRGYWYKLRAGRASIALIPRRRR